MQERGEAKRNTGLFMDDALRLTAIDGECGKLLDREILGEWEREGGARMS